MEKIDIFRFFTQKYHKKLSESAQIQPGSSSPHSKASAFYRSQLSYRVLEISIMLKKFEKKEKIDILRFFTQKCQKGVSESTQSQSGSCSLHAKASAFYRSQLSQRVLKISC